MVGSDIFLLQPKHQYHLSQWGECIFGAPSWKKKIIMWNWVIPINKWTLTLKNGGKWSFSYEAKASIHLSQWEEWICSAQSIKERRLLCKSVFILLERWTLILRMV